MKNDPWNFENDGAAERKYKAAMSNGRGRQFEMMIEGGCRHYKALGRAKIEKMPEPFRCLKKDQRGIATVRFIAHAEPDYMGTLQGGRAIVFEAKYTDKDRLLQSAVTDTQEKSLQMYSDMNALAAVCIGIQDQYFMIPWNIFAGMKGNYGRKYVTAADVEEYRVKFTGVVQFLDYVHGTTKYIRTNIENA